MDDHRCCPHCGHELARSPYLMSTDPDAPGTIDLFRAWLTGDHSVLGAIAVIGSCALFVLLVTGLAQIAARL